jgi:membrane protein implicated in regulation of membrane protease activity
MAEWWDALSALQQMFLFAAIPFTLILIIQVVLTIIGLGHDTDMDTGADMDTDTDMDSDTDADSDADINNAHVSAAGFRFFSIRGLVAFFCMFGWTGYALSGEALGTALVIAIATAAGLVAMLLIGLMFHAMRRLQQSGNLRYSNAIGHDAEVYLPIPPSRSGKGKVMVEFQERLVEAQAITDDEQKIPTGMAVRVVGNTGNTLIVKR